MIESRSSGEAKNDGYWRDKLGSAEFIGRRPLVWYLVGVLITSCAYHCLITRPTAEVIDASDYTAYQLPVHEFIRSELLQWRFPLWMPQLACGVPLHGSQVSALGHPLLTASIVLFGSNFGLRLTLFLSILIAYSGQYLLCRTCRVSAPLCALSGTAMAQGGFVVSHLCAGHVNHILTISLVPWFFTAIAQLCLAPSCGKACVVATVLALFVYCGHPQIPYYACATVAIVVPLGAITATPQRKQVALRLCYGAYALLLALALSLFQTAPVLELVANASGLTHRGNASTANLYSLRPIDLLMLIAPNATGNPYASIPVFNDERNSFHERNPYVGLVTLWLAWLAVPGTWRPTWQWGAVLVCILSLLLALGDSTPIFRVIGGAWNGLFLFRCHGRVLGVTSVLLCLLAGRGGDLFIRGHTRPTKAALAIAAILVGNGILLMAGNCRDNGQLMAQYSKFILQHASTHGHTLVAIAFSVTAICAAQIVRSTSRTAGVALLLCCLCSDLWLQQTQYFSLHTPNVVSFPTSIESPALAGQYRYLHSPTYPEVSPFDLPYDGLSYLPFCGQLGVYSVATHDGGMLPAATQRLFNAIAESGESAALRAASCAAVINSAGATVARLDGAIPRVRAVQKKHDSRLDIPIGDLSVTDIESLRGISRDRISTITELPSCMAFSVDVPEDSVLVVADTFYPGWECRIEDKSVSIRACHGIFRCVDVPAGRHRVEFRYQPWWQSVGIVSLGLSLVVIGCHISVSRWRHSIVGSRSLR